MSIPFLKFFSFFEKVINFLHSLPFRNDIYDNFLLITARLYDIILYYKCTLFFAKENGMNKIGCLPFTLSVILAIVAIAIIL